MQEPVWTFIDELKKPLHQVKPAFWPMRSAGDGELDLAAGLSVQMRFPDPDHLLETALADFERFCSVLGIAADAAARTCVTLIIRPGQTDCRESFRLIVRSADLMLEAADTEGIRRGLVFIEEQIRATGAPALPVGTTVKSSFIRTRLSRCFFGPIKRPPMNRDELEDQVDYYPDEYLNRLAHEGVNALWLTITFRDTVPSRILPGFGRRSDVHLAKLQQTVARCARYGIRIFVFFIEPTAFIDERDNHRYLDIRRYQQDYPQLIGNRQGDLAAFCPSSELARSFLFDAANNLFRRVPGLGGMIDISVGERFTHCCSTFIGQNNCPRCRSRKPEEVLADVLTSLQQGMRAASPQAEFISWPYGQYLLWGEERTAAAAGHVPDQVILQHNFESAGRIEQLGRVRRADDYWLSYTGPSALYQSCAIHARRQQTPMYAKLQVGCSHEVASVPHVPVPGILYDKYRAMHQLGVSGVMQSWYFGNYPSLMTRAAGRLAFETFDADREAFLYQLALPDWGPCSETVVQAWSFFQEAYQQYPVYHVFGYYAPVHDGPVWPLYLNPVNKPLIPNWKSMPEYPLHGDRIGECLQDAFTLEEALLLCSRLCRIWQKGLALLSSVDPCFADDPDRLRDILTARALGILFNSCHNILRFYQLREELADSTGLTARHCLDQLHQIAVDEINNSRQLGHCCRLDPALGFNSEHEGYRFYPEKLEKRALQLATLLQQDFPAVAQRIEQGLLPFPAYTGHEPDQQGPEPDQQGPEPDRPTYGCPCVPVVADGTIDWTDIEAVVIPASDGCPAALLRACTDNKELHLLVSYRSAAQTTQLRFFPQRLWPERTFQFEPQTGLTTRVDRDPERPPQMVAALDTVVCACADWPDNAPGNGFQHAGLPIHQPFRSGQDKAVAVWIRLPLDELQRPASCRLNPLRFNVLLNGSQDPMRNRAAWVRREPVAPRLAQSPVNPDEYGWLLLTGG